MPRTWPRRICAIWPARTPNAGRIFTSSTMRGCSISRASASPIKACRCCWIWRGRWICPGASPPCSAAIRSTAPRSGRCCIRRCARISRDRPRFKPRSTASRQKLKAYVAAVRSGQKRGVTGKKFRQVVNIGIGGSDLGPLLVCDALRAEWSGDITPHFVSNVDRTQLEDLTRTLDPAETLVIVCSKTFVTQETQTNANAARAWIVGCARRAGRGQSLRGGFDQCGGHGQVRHRSRSSLHHVGLGRGPLLGVVRHRPHRRDRHRQRPLSKNSCKARATSTSISRRRRSSRICRCSWASWASGTALS